MRVIVAIIFSVFFLPVFSQADVLLDKAEKAYDSKRYKEAATAYQELVNEGFKSPELYFNLGNSYYRSEQLGRAIYFYELARKLEPNDEDISVNLGIANSKTIDKIETRENFLISAVKTTLLSSLSTRSWAWLSVVCFAAACVFFFVFLASGSVAVKRTGFVLCCACAALFVLTYLLGWSASRAKYENKFAIILSKEVKVMNEPTISASSRFTLHEGTKIRVLDTNGEWLLLKLDNGNEGWIAIDDVGII